MDTINTFDLSGISHKMKAEIIRSKYILDLPDDLYDGEYAYELDTLKSAITFLISLTRNLKNNYDIEIDCPGIYHGPNGSIDILWEIKNFRMLINIPPESNYASIYGDNYSDTVLKDSVEIDTPSIMLETFFNKVYGK